VWRPHPFRPSAGKGKRKRTRGEGAVSNRAAERTSSQIHARASGDGNDSAGPG
jgi:hypothetical protein